METSQTELSASDSTEIPPLPPRHFRERFAIALVVVLAAGLMLFAVCRTIGPDMTRSFRRWASSLPVRPPMEFVAPIEETVKSTSRSFDGSISVAADAQISPPHRKSREQPTQPATSELSIDAPSNETIADITLQNSVEMTADASVPENVASISTPPAGSREIQQVDSNRELLEAAAELVSQSWQDFAYPTAWLAGETSKSRMIYQNHRNRLLKAVTSIHPTALSLEMARKDYAAAQVEFAEDPRLDYTFGLVLWKHEHQSEALEMFQTAARLESDDPFLPAALAVAWGRFLSHDEKHGLDQLLNVARSLAKSNDAYPPEPQKVQAAILIGRALGYLSKPGRIPSLAEHVELTSINILKRLPESLRTACENGRDQIDQRESTLRQFADRPFDQTQSNHRAKQDEIKAEIGELHEEMQNARNALTRNHRSHIVRVTDILKEAVDIGGQIEKLRPTMAQLKESVAKLNEGKPHVETKTMPAHFDLVTGQGGQRQLVQSNATMTVLVQETPTERAARISELNKVRDDLKKIQNDLLKLRDQQRDLVSRRHEEDRNQAIEKDEARQQRVSRLMEQRELEQKLNSLNKALRRISTLRAGIETIAAYIPWNIEIEGEALWLALNPKSVGPQKK